VADHNPKLASSELANLWNSYLMESMNICTMKHILENIDDDQIKSIVQFSKDLSVGHLDRIKSIFEKEQIPIPHGFTEEDVIPEAPRIFSDTFYLRYLKAVSRVGITLDGKSLGTSYREDVKTFYSSLVKEDIELYNQVIDLQREKGILVRTPAMEYHNQVE